MMEGGGEGVVAVVRWLSDGGLTEVGLLSSRQRSHRRALREQRHVALQQGKPTLKQTPPPRCCELRASQTFSERDHKSRMSPALCPDPYASTYQVAHCGAESLSLAHWHSEFPPQRRRPSPGLGNFQVSTERCQSPTRNDENNCQPDTNGVKGCEYRPQHDRDVDAFVTSLRKYPSVTERTPSAELLERLLKKTEARPPKDPESPPAKKKRRQDKPVTIAPLNLYANRKDRSLSNSPNRSPYSTPHRSPHRNAKSDLRQRTYGPEKYPLPDGPLSVTAFDYLKSAFTWSPSVIQPRKKIENKLLKNAYRARRGRKPLTAFPVCPTLQSRYEKHVKKYHPTTSKDAQIPHVDYASLETCSKCQQRRPCPCETARSMRRAVDKRKQEKRQLEDTIISWLKDIPIYPNENPHDKFIRDAIVKKLAETLGGMTDSEFGRGGKEEILQALNKMPMWYPSGEREKEHFKEIIAESLFDKIKGIKDIKRFNRAAEKILDTVQYDKEVDKELVLHEITSELNKIAHNRPADDATFRDLLKIKAFELLDRLPIKSVGNKYEYLNELSDQIADRLVHVLAAPIDADSEQNLNEGIHIILEATDVRDKGQVKEKLQAVVSDLISQEINKDEAEEYIKTILNGKVPHRNIDNITNEILALADSEAVKQLDPETKHIIKNDVKEMLDLSDAQIKNRSMVEEGLNKLIQDVATRRIDEGKAESQIKSLLKGKVPEDKQEDMINQILSLAGHIEASQPQPIDQETKQIIKDDVQDILDLSGVQIKNRGKVEEGLNKLIQDVATRRIDEGKAESKIKSLLKGKVPEDKQEDMINQILSLAGHIEASQPQPIDQETKQIIKDDVQDILDLSGVQIKNRGKVEDGLNKLIQDVATHRIDEGKAESQIKSLLKGKVPEDKQEDMINQILSLAGHVEASRPQPIDQETKQIIKDDVHEILGLSGVQVKNRGKVEEGLNKLIQDVVTRHIDESKAESQIKSLLKGKLPEDKQEDMINQILSLAGHVQASRTQPIDQETKQIIKDDVHEILGLSGVQIKNRGKVEDGLNKLIQDVATHRIDEGKAESQIKSLLKGKVPEDKQEDMINQILSLAGHVEASRPQPIDHETKQIIKDDVQEILDHSGVQIKNRGKVEEGLNKLIQDVATRHIDEGKAESQIKALLKGKVPEDKQEGMINQILSLAGHVQASQQQPIDQETKQIIKDDVHEILGLSGVQIKNRGKVEDGLNKLIQDVATHRIDEGKAESQIKSLLKGKVPEDKQEDMINQILSLAGHIEASQSQPIDQETKQIIIDDVHEILGLSGVQIKNRGKVEDGLNKLIQDVATHRIDEGKAESQIKSLLKGKVPEDKQEDMINQILSLAGHVEASRPQPIDHETKQIIKDDVQEILDHSGVQIKNRGKVEEGLNKLIQDVATRHIDEGKAESKIKALLKGKVPEDKQEDMINQILSLAGHIEASQPQPIDQETKQIIKDDVQDILDLSGVQIKNRGKVEDGLNKLIQDVATHRIDEGKAESQIKSLLKGKVPEDKQEDMINQILSLAGHIEASQPQPIDQETKQIIKDDVQDILDLSGVQIKNRRKVEDGLNKLIQDVATHRIDEGKAESQIKSLLKGKVPEDKQEDMINQILSLAGHVEASRPQPIDHETKQIIKDDVQEILDHSGVQIKNRRKVEEGLNKLIQDVATRHIDEGKAESQIKALLKGKVPEDKQEDMINQILSLAGYVQASRTQPIDQEAKQIIKDDIEDILDLSGVPIKNRGKVEEGLNKLIQDVATRRIDEGKAESQIKSLLKGKVPDDKQEDMINQILSLAGHIEASQPQPIDQETKQIIKDDVHEILGLSGVQIKNKGKVEDGLNKLIQDVATHRIDEGKAESQIKSLLKGKVPEDKQEDMINQILSLAGHVEASRPQPIDHETKQIIKDDVQEILDHSGVQIKNRGKVEEGLNKLIQDVATRHIDEGKAESQIKALLKGKVPEDKQEGMINQILSLAGHVQASQPQPIDQETKQIIKDDVHEILGLSGVQIKNRGKVEDGLNKLIQDVATHRIDEGKAESQIKSLLKGKVPEDKQEDMINQILSLAGHLEASRPQPIDHETKQIIKDDVQEILDHSGVQIKNKGKVEEGLNKLIQDVATRHIDEGKAESQIKALLKGKVPEDKQEDMINQILSLAGHIEASQPQPIDQETKQIIKDDVHEILGLSGVQIKNRGKVEDGLNKLIQDVATHRIDEGKAESQIKSLLKGKVPEDKQEDMINQILSLAGHVEASRPQPIDHETKQIIKDDVQEILDHSGVQIKNRGKVEEGLNKLMQAVATRHIDEAKAERQIKALLKGKLPEDKQEHMINQILSLAGHVQASRPQPIDQETKQIIKDDIEDILDLSEVPIKNRGKVEEGLNKLMQDVATRHIDEAKAERQIKALLKGKVPDDKQEDMINQILSLAAHIEASQPQPIDQETKQIIKDDVHEILDLSGVQIKNRGKVEEGLNKLIQDVATRRIDEGKAESKIKSLLKGKVPKGKQDDIIDQVLSLANQVESTLSQPLDQRTKQKIKDDVRELLDLSASVKNREKLEQSLNKLLYDLATKHVDEGEAETMIKSLLKIYVSENKVKEMTDRILSIVHQIKPTPVIPLDKVTKRRIKENVHDVLDLSGAQIKSRERVQEDLQRLIQEIAKKGMDDDEAEAKIKGILKGKISRDKLQHITSQILELAEEVKPTQVAPIDLETIEMIKLEISEILDQSESLFKNRVKIEETLFQLVRDLATKRIDEDEAAAQIKGVLNDKVSLDELEHIIIQILELAELVRPPQVTPIDREKKQIIKQNLNDILDQSDAEIKNRRQVEDNLEKLLHDVATQHTNEDKTEAMIKSILKGNVSEDKHQHISNKILALANKIKLPIFKPLDQASKEIIKNNIREVLDLSAGRIKNRGKVVEALLKLIQEVATKGLDENKAAAEIKSLLKGKVTQDQQDDIIDQILTLANQVKRRQQVLPIHQDIKQMIKNDLRDILDEHHSHIKNRDKVEGHLHNLVFNMISKGTGKEKAKTRIKKILKGVPNDKVDDIFDKILELTNKAEENHSMNIQQFEETFKNDISDLLDQTRARVKNRTNVEENLSHILSDIVMRGLDKNKAQESIHTILKGNVSDSDINEVSKKILALAEEKSSNFSQSSSGPIASSTQNEDKMYYNQVYEITRDWLSRLAVRLSAKKMHDVAEAIANETLDRQKYLQLNPHIKVSDQKESEIFKEQIYKALNKILDKKSVQSIIADVDELMHSLKPVLSLSPSRDSSRGHSLHSQQFIQENLEGALLDWLRRSPIYQKRDSKTKQSHEQIMLQLAKSLADVLVSQAISKSDKSADDILLKAIKKHIEELPLEPHFKSKDYINKLGNHLLNHLKTLQLFQDISARSLDSLSKATSQRTKISFMVSTNHLNEIVNDWCEALPLPSTEDANRVKKDLANKIILKIGEMNINQDIFNDDSFYDEILNDFIDQQANALQIGEHITDVNKKNLIDQIKQVKQKVHDDFMGRAYKQQLRESISNTLPPIAIPTEENKAAFELMKENLADAFINLNYSFDDVALKTKFKRRIIDEVNKYVNDYLGRCPGTPLSARKLGENLYKALINVPVPGDESMRSELETVRMKEVINDWLKTIPMNKQSKAEQLRANKLVTLMAQKLQELENELKPDFDEIAVEQVVEYLKKLPLRNKHNLEGMAKRLVENIKATSDSRSFVEGSRLKLMDDCLCKDLLSPHISARPSYLSCSSLIPPCGLSKEDQQLLQRIRERTQHCGNATKLRNCKDAGVNPPPLDNGSQTEMPYQSGLCKYADKPETVCPKSIALKTRYLPLSTRPCTSTGSQADVCPYMLVKEYYWHNRTGTRVELSTQTPVQESGRICIPSSPVEPTRMCRSGECVPPRRPVKRPQVAGATCRRIPRRQFASACPNECFARPRQHNCLKARPLTERDYLRSRCPKCTRRKPACLSCLDDPTRICPKCFPINICPHPTSLYFK